MPSQSRLSTKDSDASPSASDDESAGWHERFRAIFDGLPSPCVVYDQQRRFRFINKAMSQMLCRAEEEVIGLRDEDLLPIQVTQAYMPLLCAAITTGKSQTAECAFPGPLGTLCYIAYFIPVLDKSGQVREVLSISIDISQQKTVERELRGRDEEMRSLAENAPDVIARFNRPGQHLYVNRRVEEVTGLSREAVLGKTNAELGMPAHLVAEWNEARLKAFDSGQIVESEFEYEGPDGIRYFDARLIPEKDAGGIVQTVLGMTRDISAQKLAQRKLAESEERFRMAFESIPVGMFMLDARQRVQRANRALCEMLGYSEAELTKITPYDITHPDDLAEGREKTAELARGVTSHYTRDKRHITKDGRVVWGRLTTTLIRDRDGEPFRFIGILEDINERRASELELARYREHLEELVRSRTRALEASQQTLRSAERLASLGTLAAGIAHEINNPVGTILLAAEMAMAAQAAGDEEALARCLEGIKADAQRCGRIVKNILHFARQEPTDKAPQALNEVVQGAVGRTHKYALERGAQIQVNLAAEVGLVMMNSIAVEQALTNLLRNSIESRQRERIQIQIVTTASNGHYEVKISDDGPGIPRDVQMHIFDPFFTMRRKTGSMGLGLSLVHGTIKDHQGQIHVESVMGEGTTFTIELPAAASPV